MFVSGKSVFYFCCDFPLKQGRNRKASLNCPTNKQASEDAAQMSIFGNLEKFANSNALDKNQQRQSAVGYEPDKMFKYHARSHGKIKSSTKNSRHANLLSDLTVMLVRTNRLI